MKGLDSLDLFDFGILLQALANNLKVGLLAVRCDAREKFLRLDRNKLVCIYTDRPRVSLEKVLYNHRALDKAQLRACIEALVNDPGRRALSRYVVETGLVTAQQLRRAAFYQTTEEVLELFYWKNVGFEFHGTDVDAFIRERKLVAVGEPVDVETVLLQCTKTIDDIAKFNEVTPSLRDVYELHVDSLETLEQLVPDPVEREFVLLVDGVRDMRDVLRDMRMNRFEALELFYRFRKQGWIRPKNAFELLMLAENRRSEFSAEKRARVLERVNELGVEGFEVNLPLAETYEKIGARQKAAQLYLKHARKCLEQSAWDGAYRAALKASALVPQDPELREFEIDVLERAGKPAEASAAAKALAEIRLQAGDRNGALHALEHAARLVPDSPSTWLRLADLLEGENRMRRAAARLRRAGDALRARGEPQAARDAFRRAVHLCPGAWSVRYRLVEVHHACGHDDAAVQALADLIAFVTESNQWRDDAQRREHLERIEERLREMGGYLSSAAAQLGRAYAKLGDTERAVSVFRRSAEELAGAGRHRSAVETLEELIELAPTDVAARRAMAQAHVCLGDATRALSQLRRVGGQLLQARDFPTARDVFQEMLAVDAGCADAHLGLAKALLQLDEADRASACFHRVGLLYRGHGRPEAAVPHLREAVGKRPADAALLEEYCELLLNSSDDREETLQALSTLVHLHMEQDQPARAAIALTRILELDPGFPGAKSILQQAARQLQQLAEDSQEVEDPALTKG